MVPKMAIILRSVINNKEVLTLTHISPLSKETANSRKITVLMIGVLPLWADRGDSVHLREVATALPYHGVTPVVLCLPGPTPPEGTELIEVRVGALRRRFAFQLSWNLLGTLAAVRTICSYRIDVIYSRLDPGMIVGWLAALLTGRSLVVEMNGLPTQDVKLYRPHNSLLLWLTRSWEKLMYRVAYAIVGGPGYIRYIREHFQVPAWKCFPVPLGVNTNLYFPRDQHSCRQQLKISEGPLAVWMGTLTVWQGLETLLEATILLKNNLPTARLFLVGDGISRSMCEQFIQEADLHSTVVLIGHVPHELVPLYLGAADVCVACFPGNRGVNGSISALKTVSYLACGRPVITTSMDELGEIIEREGAGYCVHPDDPIEMADRMSALLVEERSDHEMRCSKAATLIGSDRTWGSAAKMIAECLRKVSV